MGHDKACVAYRSRKHRLTQIRLRQQRVVVCMRADSKAHDCFSIEHSHRPIADANAYGVNGWAGIDLIEAKSGMGRMLMKEAVCLASLHGWAEWPGARGTIRVVREFIAAPGLTPPFVRRDARQAFPQPGERACYRSTENNIVHISMALSLTLLKIYNRGCIPYRLRSGV
jgi:hypothetical protein